MPRDADEFRKYVDVNEEIAIERDLRIIDAARLPMPEQLAKMRALSRDSAATSSDPKLALVNMISAVYSQAGEKDAFIQARFEATRLAARTLAWKADRGTFPVRLSDVVHSIPTDPFDGKPLRYRREGAGVCHL